MSMKNLDTVLAEKQAIMADITNAVNENDNAKLLAGMTKFSNFVADEVRAEFEGMVADNDSRVLAARGVRMLTSAETKYWNAFISAAKSGQKNAIAGIEEAFPETVIDTVLRDIQSRFPLLARVHTVNTTLLTKWVINKQGVQSAAWGKITSAYTEELEGSIEVVSTEMCKLTAYMPIPKDLLDMGPQWVDRYVRGILVESIALGAENGIVNGTGADMPIGMTRDISADAAVVGGAYPEKTKIKLDVITPYTIGNILAEMSVSEASGRERLIDNLVFLCNPRDYYTKVMPATSLLLPDGTYKNNVMPVPMEIIPCSSVAANTAIIADAKRYNFLIGAKKQGFIERDDSVRFIEDEAVYAAKMHASGRPGDDNDCKLLDITDLESAFWANSQPATAVSTKKTASAS